MKFNGAYVHVFAFILVGMLTSPTPTQNKPQQMEVPREVLLPLTAYQPDCPLRWDYLQIAEDQDTKAFRPVIRLRNVSKRLIRAYRIIYSAPGGTGGAWNSSGEKIMPGQLIPEERLPTLAPKAHPTIDPKRESGLQGVWVFSIVRVEFDDGSSFDETTINKNLRDYLERLGR